MQASCSAKTPYALSSNDNSSTENETEDIMAEFRRLTNETKQLTNQLARFSLQPLGLNSSLGGQPTPINTASTLLRDLATAFERMPNASLTPLNHVINMDQVLINTQDKLTNIGDDLLKLSQIVTNTDTALKRASSQLHNVIQQEDTAKETMSQMQRRLSSLEQNVDQLVRGAPRDPMTGAKPTWNVATSAAWHGRRLIGASCIIQHIQSSTVTTVTFEVVGEYARRKKLHKHRYDSPEVTATWNSAREAARAKAGSWNSGEAKSVMIIMSPEQLNPPSGLEPNQVDRPCACINDMLRRIEPHKDQLVCRTRRLCQEILLALQYETQHRNINAIQLLRLGSTIYE